MDGMKMNWIPMIPAGNVIPCGLSRFDAGFRLRLPLWFRSGIGYDICIDEHVHARWVKTLFVKVWRAPDGFTVKVAVAEVRG